MKVSVVIPCRNESLYIQECIEAIYASDSISELKLEVLVVDGMSDDGTRQIVQDLLDKYSGLKLVDNELQLTPYAFNLGIYAGSPCDFVQIIGARHIVSPNYIQTCLETLQKDDSIWCVGGRVINEYTNATSEIISSAMGSRFGMGIGNFRTLKTSGFTDTVTSPMYPFWVFEKIGYFDEELVRNQDDDFNFRVTQAGGKIYYCHDISLKYYVRASYGGLRMQFFQYGYWKVYVNKKHKAITTLRQIVPPLFVTYLLIFPWFFAFGSLFGLCASLPFCFYVMLNLIESIKNQPTGGNFIRVFQAYLLLHLSYGLGYLRGIVDFMFLRRSPSSEQKRLSR